MWHIVLEDQTSSEADPVHPVLAGFQQVCFPPLRQSSNPVITPAVDVTNPAVVLVQRLCLQIIFLSLSECAASVSHPQVRTCSVSLVLVCSQINFNVNQLHSSPLNQKHFLFCQNSLRDEEKQLLLWGTRTTHPDRVPDPVLVLVLVQVLVQDMIMNFIESVTS